MMRNIPVIRPVIGMTLLSSLLAACGGGGGSSTTSTSTTGGTTSTTPATTTTTTVTKPAPVTTTPVSTPAITNTSTTTPSTTQEQAVFNALNAKRSLCGFGTLSYSTELAKAASNHAQYLNYVSAQNKTSFASHNEGEMTSNGILVPHTAASTNPYYSGTLVQNRINVDPTNSAQPVSYGASLVTENLSVMTTTTNAATFDSTAAAQSMLSGLLAAPYHLRNLVNPSLSQVGASYQQSNWQNGAQQDYVSTLEMVSATPANVTLPNNTQLLSYPCAGVTDADYQLTDESPSPVPTRDLATNPIGQPIYILAPSDKTIASVEATITTGNTNVGKMNILTQATDPNSQLKANEAFILPDVALKPSITYQVSYTVHYSTGETAQNSFSFTTHGA